MNTKLNKFLADLAKTRGDSITLGSFEPEREVIPTGSMALDYCLGTGGWPLGDLIGVYGPRDIGKSSCIGLAAIASAQRLEKNVAMVLTEPGFDPTWARKHGVDPDNLIIARPNTGEEAFDILYELVTSQIIDLIVFDSIGGILAETEIFGTKTGDAKAKAGGQAGLITWGVKRIMTPAWKNRCSVIFINQVRDIMSSTGYGGYQQPGGNALEHAEGIIVQLKRGQNKYTIKVEGEKDPVEYGYEIKAVIQRNKHAEGSKRTATFDFYNMEMPGFPLGIDRVQDLINTGKRTGVIQQGGPMYTLPGEVKLKGKDAVREHLTKNPQAYDEIRALILKEMDKKYGVPTDE